METQEIKITASISLEVPIELSKEELLKKFDQSWLQISTSHPITPEETYYANLEIIEIEEEAEIYGNE